MSANSAWLRQADESGKAYQAFTVYRDLGPARSLVAAYLRSVPKRHRKSSARAAPGIWLQWSSKHDWPARAQAFDDFNGAEREKARQRAQAKEADKWARRREQQRERDFTLGEELQNKAKTLLKRELDTRAGDVPRMAEAGSKLARLAAGLETDHTRVTGAVVSAEIDLSDRTDEQLRDYLARLADIARGLAAASGATHPSAAPGDADGDPAGQAAANAHA